jgi:hypothetical protein
MSQNSQATLQSVFNYYVRPHSEMKGQRLTNEPTPHCH